MQYGDMGFFEQASKVWQEALNLKETHEVLVTGLI